MNVQELPEKEQKKIIDEIEKKYLRFFNPDFDINVFLQCRNNFAQIAHIESVKIFDTNNPPHNPTFTIAIPTYNRCETLKEAIDSALKQETEEKYEIIVVENVDDFNLKTPAQEMLEQKYFGKLTYYKNRENIGLHNNHNRCLSLSKGQWVCILHSDDTISSNYIAEMKKALKLIDQDNTIFIGCLDQKKEKKNMIFDDCSRHTIMIDCPPNAILHHKESVIKMGGYNQDEYPIADTFFFCRAHRLGKTLVLQKRLQDKRDELSEYFHPRTLALYCFFGGSFILKTYKPRWYAKHQSYQYIKSYQTLIQNNHLLNSFISTKLTQFNITPPTLIDRLMIKFWNKIFTRNL